MDNLKVIAFDIYGTLISAGHIRHPVMEMLKILKRRGHTIIVWSDHDRDEVITIISDLGLTKYVDIAASKSDLGTPWLPFSPDITFDDQPTSLGKIADILV